MSKMMYDSDYDYNNQTIDETEKSRCPECGKNLRPKTTKDKYHKNVGSITLID